MAKSNIVELSPPRLHQFLRLDQVRALTGMPTSSIYDKMSRGEFPRPVKLSNNPKAKKHSVRWLEDEVMAWQEARIAERDASPKPKPYRPRRRTLAAAINVAG
jgi:prophage regulatory protein